MLPELMMAEAHVSELRRQGDTERLARRALLPARIRLQIRGTMSGALRAIARAIQPAPAPQSAN
jgi:hypothetical protein